MVAVCIAEVIVFPNLFEQVGAALTQDAVIRATGKASARDRDGNLTSDVKLIADEIQLVDDEELRTYESTGRAMAKPKGGAVKAVRTPRSQYAKPHGSGGSFTRQAAAGPATSSAPKVSAGPPPVAEVLKKVYVHVKNPDDQQALMQVRNECTKFPGLCDMVLVLGPEKQSAIKMPFRVDGSDELIGRLVKILGEDAVVLK